VRARWLQNAGADENFARHRGVARHAPTRRSVKGDQRSSREFREAGPRKGVNRKNSLLSALANL
jgi:hypothetical protein